MQDRSSRSAYYPNQTNQRVDKNENRYEHPPVGDLVHIDVKEVGRIPDGGGWRCNTEAHQ